MAQNPRILGLGIDENTAIVVRRRRFQVLGEGAVYVVDGRRVSFSNLAEERVERTLSIFNVRLHLLSRGDKFDLEQRRPSSHPAEVIERELRLGEAADE